MASPQTENGYFKVSNELWDALVRTRIPGEARQVLDCVIRKTYGYREKVAAISLADFVEATGLTKPHACRGLRKLKQMNIVAQNGNGDNARYGIQKNYEKWKPLPKTATLPKTAKPVAQNGNAIKIKDNLKDNNNKGADPSLLARRFVGIAKKYVDTFAVRPMEDAQWFDERIIFGKYGEGLDIDDVLVGWETWMAEQFRRKNAGRPNKFPKSDYRGSFRNRCKIEQRLVANRREADGEKRPWDLGKFD